LLIQKKGENKMADIRLTKTAVLEIELHILTGIHIGGSKEIYGIGGIDNPVIKNPLDNKPIIPGSSFKGKIRNLLELNGQEEEVEKLFAGDDLAPSRVIFRDMKLSDDSSDKIQEILGFGVFTEVKAENTIDKRTGKANPRLCERVPSGAVFQSEVVVNAYNDEDVQEIVSLLKQGFQLLELNYLGGSGTRGYGKVKVDVKNERVI